MVKRVRWMLIFLIICLVGCSSTSGQTEEAENLKEESEWSEGTKEEEGEIEESETKLTPPEDEYDVIIASDERYFLCKKLESGFEEETTLYGLYDGEIGEWAVEFTDLGVMICDFNINGDGVFSFSVNNGYRTSYYFISADYGGVLEVDLDTLTALCDEVFFHDKNAFAFINSNEESPKRPDAYLYRLSTTGEMEEVKVPGYSMEECFWVSANIVDPKDEDLYARVFRGYTEDDDHYCLFIYLYETDESMVINIDEYHDNMTLCMGITDKNSIVSLKGEYIRIENLDGADGKTYYVEYDLEGNLATEPTLM